MIRNILGSMDLGSEVMYEVKVHRSTDFLVTFLLYRICRRHIIQSTT